ncbi:MAG: hypothetical protein WC668_00675 [Patescibacteria group bacterium]|jgi:hypothetical protein
MINQEKGVISEQAGDFLVIKFEDGRELLWPKKEINWIIKDGETVKISILPEQIDDKYQEDQTKNLLKKIFQTDNA